MRKIIPFRLNSSPAVRRGWMPSWRSMLACLAAGFIAVTLYLTVDLRGVWRRVTAAATATQKASTPSMSRSVVGRASVIDGDTVDLQGVRIRLNGIDAPESRQVCEDSKGGRYLCGSKAAEALRSHLAQSQPTRCELGERDRYGRYVAKCFRADGGDVASWLVRNGHALDWPRYSGGAYSRVQQEAKMQRRGVWQGRFQPPWEWRAAKQKSGASL